MLKHGVVHAVYCVAVSPREDLIVEGSFDSTMRLWSIGAGSRIHRKLEFMSVPRGCTALGYFTPALACVEHAAHDLPFFFMQSPRGSQARAQFVPGPPWTGGAEAEKTVPTLFALGYFVELSSTALTLAFALHPFTNHQVNLRKAKESARQRKFEYFGTSAEGEEGMPEGRASSPKGEDEPLRILRGHRAPVISVEFNRSGSMLCSGSHDGTVALWDVKSWTVRYRLESISGSPVWSCHLSSDSSLLAMGCGDGRFCVRQGGVRGAGRGE